MRWALVLMTAVVAGMLLGGCAEQVERQVAVSPDGSAPLAEAEDEYDAGAADYAYEEATPDAAPMRSEAPAGEKGEGAPSRPRREPASPAADTAEDFAPREAAEPESEPRTVPKRTREDRRQRLQAGTLTAGSFDDVERFDDFRRFVSDAMQEDREEELPRLPIGRRVMIYVTDAEGRPIGDARVVVRPADSRQQAKGPPLLDLPTGTDGRTMLLTAMDGPGQEERFHVTVHPPNGAEAISTTMRADQTPWRITLKETKAKRPTRLDLALVIDTTGSMGDELEYLKVEIDSIARSVHEMFPNVDQRYALVLYRDEGDRYVTRTFDFTSSLGDFRSKLSAESADGGGNYPEAMHLALEHAGQLDWRDRDTARVMFLVADAPPHDVFADRTLKAVGVLRQKGVRVFPVASSGVALKAEFVMRAAGFLTMGKYAFLTDHSGVGNPHAKPHVPEYLVERLDRLMIRMITSELSGRRLAPDEVIAIERGEMEAPFGPVDVPPEQIPHEQQPREVTAAATAALRLSTESFRLPRWLLLAAVLVGVAVFDTVTTRKRP